MKCTILTEKKTQKDATLYQNFIIPYFKWSSTCFGRHTGHHQELKTAQAASGFAYVEGCQTLSCPTTFHVCKTRGCLCSFKLLMMGGVSPETCWASYKYGIINFDTLLHLVGFFLCKNCTVMHGSTNVKLWNVIFSLLVWWVFSHFSILQVLCRDIENLNCMCK